MRLISFAALAARSPCAPDAVLCSDWMPADATARSGFLVTIASPLVRIAGVMVEVDADGALSSNAGRLDAMTIAAIASAQLTAIATGTANFRMPGTTTAKPRM